MRKISIPPGTDLNAPLKDVANGAQYPQVSQSNSAPPKLLEVARVRPTDTIEADPVAIWVKDKPERVQFGTLGNFSMITGKAKSKKSFALCLAIAPAIDGSQYNVGPFDVELPKDKPRVLYFDTEQGKYRVWKALNRVCRMAGIDDPPQLEYFDLRPYDTLQRVSLIGYALNDGNPKKDIGLVIVDGCRDLIHDINDPKDATKLATHFLQWTANNHLHLITVLHQNKADNNARGHVGTELINKAETVISVEVEKNDTTISIVKPEQTRAEGFNGFAFNIVEGVPTVLPDYELNSKGTASKKAFNPYDYHQENHHRVLSKVFQGESLGYKDFQSKLKVEWNAYGQVISNQTTQDLITYYHHKMKWVTHNGKQGKAAKYNYQPH